MSRLKTGLIAAGLCLVCAELPSQAGIVFDSQTRFVKYWQHDEPTPFGIGGGETPHDTFFINTSTTASDFSPFTYLTGTFANYVGVSEVSSILPAAIIAKGHAYPSTPPNPGNSFTHTLNGESHCEVTFTLSDPTPYELAVNPLSPGLPGGPATSTVKLTGPGGQTLNFLTPTDIYAAHVATYTGTLAAGQWTFLADAFNSAGNPFPGPLNPVYDVSLQLPEPGSAAVFALGGALTFRRRRQIQS